MREVLHDKKAVIAALAASHHGDLAKYLPTAKAAAAADPDFFGHLVSWNHVKGSIRDAKIALPIIALLETHQQADGSVRVPQALQPYLGGLEVLKPLS
jgi:hypothetical protein